jgi:hypothetical protein
MNKFETSAPPVIKEAGFREYDARWVCPTAINLEGLRALGLMQIFGY